MSRALDCKKTYFPEPVDAEMKVVKDTAPLLPELCGIVDGYLAVQRPRQWSLTPKSSLGDSKSNEAIFIGKYVFDWKAQEWLDDDSIIYRLQTLIAAADGEPNRVNWMFAFSPKMVVSSLARNVLAEIHYLLRHFEERGLVQSRFIADQPSQ